MTSHNDVKGEGSEALGSEQPQQEPSAEATPLDVYGVLRIAIAQLAAVAWQMMGLQPDPFTNTVRKDMNQARVAIDATAALIEHLKPQLQGQEAREYQTLLTDLRLNFVSHSEDTAKS